MAKDKLIRFGVKNGKYAVLSSGSYGTIKDLPYLESITLEADYDELDIFGDNEILDTISDDKGKTGTLEAVNINDEYEIDMKRKLVLENGSTADIQQRASVVHAIYFETDGRKEGVPQVIKVWLFGCVTGKPSEKYNQTKEDPTINTVSHSLKVRGTKLQVTAGTSDYTDENGQTYLVWYLASKPDDDDYETFGATVPVPKYPSGV